MTTFGFSMNMSPFGISPEETVVTPEIMDAYLFTSHVI